MPVAAFGSTRSRGGGLYTVKEDQVIAFYGCRDRAAALRAAGLEPDGE